MKLDYWLAPWLVHRIRRWQKRHEPHLLLLFLYSINDAVHWGDSVLLWCIMQRRWTERQTLPPIVEYGLVPWHSTAVTIHWAYEADLTKGEPRP
jgi:hypothetical protein